MHGRTLHARFGSESGHRAEASQRRFSAFIKRLIDVVGATVGLVLLAPLFLVVALAVVLDSPGPVFFRHRRAGKGNRPIQVLKFRSMIDGADLIGPEVTASNDERITRVGAFLRKTKLDELPQLWNVLKGDMSLVGPRPQSFSLIEHYPEEDAEVILSVRPGITGPTQLWLRDEEELLGRQPDPMHFYVHTLLPKKIASDKAYVQTWSLKRDFAILFRTLLTLFARRPDTEETPTYAVVREAQIPRAAEQKEVV
ncbi:MAG: sugar transferase [Fimbriimonadales bacterium]|nr:MAG: sugar transferase [Fimbriimonadales bacterium]